MKQKSGSISETFWEKVLETGPLTLNAEEDYGVDTLKITDDDAAFILGKGGKTKDFCHGRLATTHLKRGCEVLIGQDTTRAMTALSSHGSIRQPSPTKADSCRKRLPRWPRFTEDELHIGCFIFFVFLLLLLLWLWFCFYTSMWAGDAVRKKYMGDLRCGWMMGLSPFIYFK